MRWRPILNRAKRKALYTRLLPQLRRIARKGGWALAVHGSMARDLDLVAVRWTRRSWKPETLLQRMALACCGMKYSSFAWTQKEHGRRATTIAFGRNVYLDISMLQE